ncbi:MAG: hypothetical protein WHS45_10695 [Anaerolinea sp.]
MQKMRKVWFFIGFAILAVLFLWVSLPAPVERVSVSLEGDPQLFTEVVLLVPRWGWVGRSVEIQTVMYKATPEKMVVRARLETSPGVLGSGEESQVVQGTSPVQWTFPLTSMTPGHKAWRVWLWAGDSPAVENLYLVRGGKVRILGISGIPVSLLQGGLALVMVLLILARVLFQSQYPPRKGNWMNCDKINRN